MLPKPCESILRHAWALPREVRAHAIAPAADTVRNEAYHRDALYVILSCAVVERQVPDIIGWDLSQRGQHAARASI